MAEIDVKKKNRTSGGWILLIILLVIIAVVLILDATEAIHTPNWIQNVPVNDTTTVNQTY